MEDLRIGLIQQSLQWEDKDANLNIFSEKIRSMSGEADLVLLPEMFSTGFSMQAQTLAEEMNGTSVSWMRKMAAEKNCTLCGSLIIREGGRFYNRLVWMNPDGSCLTYDKRHLFRLAEEEKTYTPGTKKIMPELRGWKILPLICYDLRFPVWSRRTPKENYDLLVYVANWPNRRIKAWNTLLPARAVENQCYVAGLNRVGKDGHDISHAGYSGVYDFTGESLWIAEAEASSVQIVTLHAEILQKFRTSLPFDRDADAFIIS
jgi:omega-amidase